MGLSAAHHSDLGIIEKQKKAHVREQDESLIAQIIEPVLGDKARNEARKLIGQFRTINGVFHHFSHSRSLPSDRDNPAAPYLKLVAKSFSRALEREVLSGPVLPSSKVLHDYLFNRFASNKVEMFRVLFLDAANRLLEDRLMTVGTTNRVQIYPREIVNQALKLNATAVILVHNHPSGDPRPSQSDVTLTEKISKACSLFELEMIDHLIVARSGITSFRALGLTKTSDGPKPMPETPKRRFAGFFEQCVSGTMDIIRKSL